MDRAARIRRNIKALRETYGETQQELSLALDVSESAISNYETGARTPIPKILQKIADHFNVTLDQLSNEDIPGIGLQWNTLCDQKKMLRISLELHPMILPCDSISDPLFLKGCKAQQEFLEQIVSDNVFSEDTLEEMWDAYIYSYEKNGTIESLVNLLGVLLMFEVPEDRLRKAEILEDMRITPQSGKEYFKRLLLKQFDIEPDNPILKTDDVTNEMEDMILDMIKKLRSVPQWADLAYYYAALRYCKGVAGKGLNSAEQAIVGNEMMQSCRQIGNKYAKKLFQIEKQFFLK